MVHLSQICLRRCGLEFLTDFTDFTDFRGGVEQVIKRVIISLSEAGRGFLAATPRLLGQLVGYAVICCDYKPRR